MESSRELPIDWSLQSAVIIQDKDAALNALAKGINIKMETNNSV